MSGLFWFIDRNNLKQNMQFQRLLKRTNTLKVSRNKRDKGFVNDSVRCYSSRVKTVPGEEIRFYRVGDTEALLKINCSVDCFLCFLGHILLLWKKSTGQFNNMQLFKYVELLAIVLHAICFFFFAKWHTRQPF